MINKYTLKFKDSKIEDKYEEYQNLATRKSLVLQLSCLSFIWNMTDLTQILIVNDIYNMDIQAILTDYLPQFILLAIYLGVYFFKPSYSKFMILVQNHIFAYLYWIQFQWLFQQQAAFYTYLIVGTQFLCLMSLEFLIIAYQVLLFTSVYLAQMMLEAPPLNYSFFTTTILTVFVFLYNYYNHCNQMRQQFKLRFIDNQWEKIFIALTNQGYLIFEFDELNHSFNYRNQFQYNEKINDTQSLKEYLRSAKTQGNKLTLEQFIYGKLNSENNIIKQDLEVQNGIQSHKNYQIKYSIFLGVSPIIVFQPIDKKDGRQMTDTFCNLKEVEQSYYSKYIVFMSLAKRLIFTSKKRFPLNFQKFKRLCIFENLGQYLIQSLKLNKDLPLKCIKIETILNKIIKLFPHIKIIIVNQTFVDSIINNKQLVIIILIGVLEKTLNNEITITVKNVMEQKIQITIRSYFNDDNFLNIKQIVKQYKTLIPGLILDNSSITIFISDNDQIESTDRKVQTNDFSKDIMTSNCSCGNQGLQKEQQRQNRKQENQVHQYDVLKSDKI